MKKRRFSAALLIFLAVLLLGCSTTVETDDNLQTVADVRLKVEGKILVLAITPKMALPRDHYIFYRCFKDKERLGYGAVLVSELMSKSKPDGPMLLETACQASEIDNVMVSLTDTLPLVF
jgi:hypothetical protein